MSPALAEVAPVDPPLLKLVEPTHALHVKNVPYEVWCRARHNANLSQMTLRDYVIRLLADAQPYVPAAQIGTMSNS